ASFTVPVEDTDAAYARALAAGASSLAEPSDWFEGFRQAAVRDPFGHRWYFATVADSVAAHDVQRARGARGAERGGPGTGPCARPLRRAGARGARGTASRRRR